MSGPASLGVAAQAAIAHVERLARGDPAPADLRLTVNFHPDRTVEGASVIDGLARTDRYLPQFVTGISNGGLTAHPGGDRWIWEREMFGGAYEEAAAEDRPIYGSVDHGDAPLGGAPRFGSAYLLLRPEVLSRATFCFPDSVFRPADVGTASRFALIPLVQEFASRRRSDLDEQRSGGVLDAYIEAQIHGGVVLSRDVRSVALDPSFRGTQTEAAARALPVPVLWHEGRVADLPTIRQHPDYRGPEIVAAAERIARDGSLHARLIGEAAASGLEDPQVLKKVWHYVARFGRSGVS